MNKSREGVILRTSFVGIGGNVLLVVFKAIVGFLSGSIAIVMDALNNLTDALSSIITICGTRFSMKKPDRKHPFGYGRVEYLTSAIIAALILFAGATAVYESIKAIIDHYQNGTMPEYSIVSLVIVAVALVIKIFLGLYFKKKAKDVDSNSLKASGNEALLDSILSAATLIAAIIVYTTNIYIEGYLGVIIGVFVVKSGVEALVESLSSILGERYDYEFIQEIKKEIKAIDGVNGVYDLILNSYGPNKHVGSVHIAVKDSLTATEIQRIEKDITLLMYTKYQTIMTTGIYAENENTPFSKEVKDKVLQVIKEYSHILQMHGFYIDEDKKFVNFDLVIDFKDDKADEHVQEIKEKLESIYEGYSFVINNDTDFSLT